MKKLIIMSLVSLTLTPGFAQFTKGDHKIGGIFNISYDGSKTKKDTPDTTIKGSRTFDFHFMPDYGYFIDDNTCIGAFIDIHPSHTTRFQSDNDGDEIKVKDKTMGFGIGPQISHFRFLGEKKKFGIYGSAGLGFTMEGGKVESYNGVKDEIESADKNRKIGVDVWWAPGMVYMPADWFFFNVRFDGLGIEYSYTSEKDEGTSDKYKTSHFRFGGDLNELFLTHTYVGVSFIL